MKSKIKLLLLKDVEEVGRSGEVVLVKPGFSRNFLIPKKFAVIADINTLKMQARLQKERAIKAAVDRKEAEELAKIIEGLTLSITVKVDAEGKMFGSVTSQDIVDLLQKQNIILNKKNIGIKKHLKEIGLIEIPIKLKEGVEAKVKLNVIPHQVIVPKEEKPKEERKSESAKEEKSKKEKFPAKESREEKAHPKSNAKKEEVAHPHKEEKEEENKEEQTEEKPKKTKKKAEKK